MLTFTASAGRSRRRMLSVLGAVLPLAVVFGLGMAPAAAVAAEQHPIGSYEKYPWSSTLYRVGTPYTATAVTYEQWRAAGYPAPQTKLVLGSSVTTYATHPEDIFIGPFVDDTHPRVDLPHHVTLSEWKAVGSPSATRAGVGFVKTATSANIYECSAVGTTAYYPHLLTLDEWQGLGSPTPVVVAAISGTCP